MRIKSLFAVLTAIALTFIGGCRTGSTQANSDVKAETDDRLTPLTANLVNTDKKIEDHMNAMINQARQETRGTLNSHGNWTNEQKEALLRRVYDLLGAYRPGTGIIVGAFGIGKEVSLHPEVVFWLAHNLDDEKNEIVYLRFKQSRYGANVIGILNGKVVAHKSLKAADHSIAPVIKNRDILLGTDKWGHFSMQGYWYWASKLPGKVDRTKYGMFMEGDPALAPEERAKFDAMAKKWISSFRFGYFGAWSTGVISHADMQANEAGFQMYSSIFADPDGYQFSLDQFADALPQMNEQNNPNKYSYGVEANDTTKPVKIDAEVKEIVSLMKASKYAEALTAGDRIVKKMDLVREYYRDEDYSRYNALRGAAWYYYMKCKEPSEGFMEAMPSEELLGEFGLPGSPVNCQN